MSDEITSEPVGVRHQSSTDPLRLFAVKLREFNFSEQQITLVIGELTEHRQASYLQGYKKGYEEGYSNYMSKIRGGL